MNVYDRIAALADYGIEHELIAAEDRCWAINSLLSVLALDDLAPSGEKCEEELEALLRGILDDADGRKAFLRFVESI